MGSVVQYPIGTGTGTGTGAVLVGGKVVGRITKINIAVASDDGGKVSIETRRDRTGLGSLRTNTPDA